MNIFQKYKKYSLHADLYKALSNRFITTLALLYVTYWKGENYVKNTRGRNIRCRVIVNILIKELSSGDFLVKSSRPEVFWEKSVPKIFYYGGGK